jgi:hypothetical protein
LQRLVTDDVNEVNDDPPVEVGVVRLGRQADDRRPPADDHLIRVADVERPPIGQMDAKRLERLQSNGG